MPFESLSAVRLPQRSGAVLEERIADGRAALCLGRVGEALALADAVLRENPTQAAAHVLRGEALFLRRDMAAALASYRQAMDCGLAADFAAFQAAMSGAVAGDFGWFAAMLLGRFEEAWRISDRTLRQRRAAGTDDSHLPRHLRCVWRGEPLAGRRVLVRCNHGLGDTIHFIRYIPMLRRQAARVTVEAPAELLALLSTVDGIDRLIALDEPTDAWDVEIELAELMHALRTTPETLPAAVPYLTVPVERIAAERDRLGRHAAFRTAALAVGVVWAAGAWRPERNLPSALLARLAAAPGIVLVNLQRGPAQEALARPGAPAMIDAAHASSDIVETAAIIRSLDLVISVDTMVAHLAGALGAPIWLLLHDACDWRWLLEGERSPWYPTMRLFRQPAGDWAPVIRDVTERLAFLARPAARSAE